MSDVNWVALTVFVLLFAFITWLGFAAAHWRKGDLDQLHEWGLGGRRFGTIITWFLVCLLYTSPSPRDGLLSRMPSSA